MSAEEQIGSYSIVGSFDTFDHGGPFALRVVGHDDEYGWLGRPDGGADVVLAQKVRVEGKPENTQLIIPIAFATVDQARRAGDVLAKAFATVRRIAEERLAANYRCEHRLLLYRFSRSLPQHVVCELCGEVWKPDKDPS